MRVNVESKMLADPRFKILGHRLRIPHQEAWGRVLPVWNMAYERRSEFMDAEHVDALAEMPGFAEAMVAVDLASEHGTSLRLCGVEERIKWLLAQDAKRKSANEARQRKRSEKSTETSRESPPGTFPGEVPVQEQEHDLSGSGSSSPEAPDPGATVRAERVAQPAPDRRIRLNYEAWRYAAEQHRRLRSDGITPDAIAFPSMPAGDAATELGARAKELLALSDPPDYDAAAAKLKLRVDVAVAESRREQHLRWFTPSQLWDAKRFWRGIEISPTEAARPRPPPRGSPARPDDDPSPRPMKTFT